jgi:hypothetical protein
MRTRLSWCVIALVLTGIARSAWSQEQWSTDEAFRMVSGAGVPSDWTHRHVVFSSVSSIETLSDIQQEPRYWLQQLRRREFPVTEKRWVPRRRERIERDWNEAMNTGFSSFNGVVYPAKYSFNSANPTPSCNNDFVVFTSGLSGPATNFNIVAFTNLYLNGSGGSPFCAGAGPKLLFAYYASTGSTPGGLNTSPVLSLDGTQVAFIEAAGSGAIFHVLKWQATASTPTFPAITGTLSNCVSISALPCEYSLNFSGTTRSTNSSPFVDYKNDTAYVSDNAGNIYAISPVFGGGAPAVKSGWPVSVGGSPVMAPVYDSVSKRVFAADASGKLYYVATTGTCSVTPAPCLGGSVSVSSGSVPEPPVIDSSTQKVFVFTNSAPSGSGVTGAAVVQVTTALSNKVVAGIGGGSTNVIHLGDFNNIYLSSGPGASGAALYACGDSSLLVIDAPVLYAFPFTSTPSSGTLNPSSIAGSGLFLTTGQLSAGSCSSITENFNQSTSRDSIFVGVTKNCGTGETNGCVLSYNITGGFPSGTSATAPSAHAPEPGGTSGIIVDNVSDQAGGAKLTTDIYFFSAESGGAGQSCAKYSGGTVAGDCAVSMTQTGLN